MIEKQKLKWVYIISIIYIVLNTVLIANEFYWFAILPAVLYLIYIFFFSLDKLILLIVFFTPLAVNIENLDFGARLSIPTEPLMFGVMILFFIKLLIKADFDIKIIKHPVSIAILINLAWILLTSLTSQLVIVSLKYSLAKLWFVVCFYFMATQLFKKYKNIKVFSWLYVASLTGVIFYTTYNHYLNGFSEKSGHWVMTPFYNDHTAYGAILALLIPVFSFFSFNMTYKKSLRVLSFFVTIMLITALILSFSRAAWISVIIAFIVFLIIIFKINYKIVLTTLIILSGLFIAYQSRIIEKLERNKQDASANFVEHVQSISNISSDASNLERINRWQSALRMFNKKPLLGWGPGTYQFLYAPYQRTNEKTTISTNAGDKGNAHSEYIGPLAESGILGMLTFICILITVIYTAARVYRNSQDKDVKALCLTFMLSLTTYFAHGLLNNFLDTDKASVLFWGFIAIIVALDVYHKNGQKAESDQN